MSYNSKTGKYEGFIYCIKNDINSLMYIGQTSSTLKHRFLLISMNQNLIDIIL